MRQYTISGLTLCVLFPCYDYHNLAKSEANNIYLGYITKYKSVMSRKNFFC